MHRAELLNESDHTIIATYQLEFRGIANYYQYAYKMGSLQSLKWVMEQSLTKTLARHPQNLGSNHLQTLQNPGECGWQTLQGSADNDRTRGKEATGSNLGCRPLEVECEGDNFGPAATAHLG